jgi:hypothetical protein
MLRDTRDIEISAARSQKRAIFPLFSDGDHAGYHSNYAAANHTKHGLSFETAVLVAGI